jgi:hypothetical protein
VVHVAGAGLVALLVASAVGGMIQGSIGFGFALVVVPTLTIVQPEAVPPTVLLMALPLTAAMAWRERGHIDRRGFGFILFGRLVGTAAGVAIVLTVPLETLPVVIGTMIVLAVLLSAAGIEPSPTPAVAFGAGMVSSVMGTTSAIGGPILAVVYQRRPGPELRSTLAISFFFGVSISLAALALAGEVQRWHPVLALELIPALLLGLWLSRRVASVIDERWLRPAVLIFAGAAGLYIVGRALAV